MRSLQGVPPSRQHVVPSSCATESVSPLFAGQNRICVEIHMVEFLRNIPQENLLMENKISTDKSCSHSWNHTIFDPWCFDIFKTMCYCKDLIRFLRWPFPLFEKTPWISGPPNCRNPNSTDAAEHSHLVLFGQRKHGGFPFISARVTL